MKIAVIGQGYVGGAYSDWLESRGHNVIRYGLEKQFADNRKKVAGAEVAIIAVPTPTTDRQHDPSPVYEAMGLVNLECLVILKSTVLPGITDELAADHPLIVHAPEFLRAAHAREDAAHPDRTVIGIPEGASRSIADRALKILPKAQSIFYVSAKTAEFIKYAANIMLISKLVTANALWDSMPAGTDWDVVKVALASDPRIGPSHMDVTQDGRGAGGPCFIKDIAAFVGSEDNHVLETIELANRDLLMESGKDLDILADVYGEPVRALMRRMAYATG